MPVIYFILLITSVFFYILYEPAFSFYLFAFFLITPLALFIMTLYTARHTKVSFVTVQSSAGRSAKIPVVLKVENTSKLPGANLLIEIEYFNTLDSKKNLMKINTPVYQGECQYLTMHISAVHYGTVKLHIKRCRLTDMLRLFTFKLRYPKAEEIFKQCSLTIVPDGIAIENNIANYSEMGLETDEYSKYHKGDDPSEIFDIHEYVDGDKINRIHWKLSAKQDKTMVKDYSLPISNSIILMLDMSLSESPGDTLAMYDTIIETAAAISNHLIINETPHKVIWYDNERSNLVTLNITDEESHRILVSMLLQAKLYKKHDLALINYVNDAEHFKCGHLMYFSTCYSSGATELMNDGDLAYKYSYLFFTDEEESVSTLNNGLYDEFAQIVPVYPGKAAECIQDICL